MIFVNFAFLIVSELCEVKAEPVNSFLTGKLTIKVPEVEVI